MNKVAYLAMGCFWQPDKIYSQTKGVISTTVGYSGGNSINPTYEDIQDHAETIKIIYNPALLSFEQLLEIFFSNHNHQLSRTDQYRSIIFYTDIGQKEIAQSLIRKYSKSQTKIVKFRKFYPAEEYHQKYLEKHSFGKCG